jgi:TP901 family phage tail tape measure protein
VALNARDLWIVLRARDEASRVLNSFNRSLSGLDKKSAQIAAAQIARGRQLMMLGSGMAAIGVAGIAALNNMTDAAMRYNQQAALTLTQTDNVGASLNQLKQIGKDVARTIPVPFEEIQGALYDIFSSMDVNVPQAKTLLVAFSKAAVAGQVDLSTASRATIAVMNAWGLKIEDVTRVNDVMFQLVRKGVGTYQQFASTIGRAIPSAVKAGQSVETLAGMLAFLTRNGLSTSQAATSAARALDAMSNPKTVSRLDEMGVKTKDMKGEFLPLVGILQQLNDKFKTMTAPERAAALQDLFKGSGGTIQAQRFFNLAFKNFDEFQQRVKEMEQSQGTLEQAYTVMFDTPQAKMQLMNNKYQAMATEIGDNLIPIKLKLVEVITKLLDKWNSLSPTMQKIISYSGALTAGLLLLGGAITVVSGAMLIMTARWKGLTVAMETFKGMQALFMSIKTWPQLIFAVGTAAEVSSFKIKNFFGSFKGQALGAAGIVAAVTLGIHQLLSEMSKSSSLPQNATINALTEFSKEPSWQIGGPGKNDLNKLFSNWTGGIKSTRDDLNKSVDDIDSAFNKFFNRSKWDAFNDTMNSAFGAKSSWGTIKDRFGDLDDALAQMVQGGNVDAAQNAFKNLLDIAQAQGGTIEQTTALFPKYKDAIAGVTSAQAKLAQETEKYPNLVQDVTVTLEDQVKQIQDWLDATAKQDAAFVDLGGAYDNLIQANKDSAQAAADATKSTKDSWEDFINKFPVTVDGYLKQLQTMVDQQNAWEKNMILLSGRVPQEVLDELRDLGPKGAPLVAQLVTASDKQLDKLVDLFGEKSADATNAFADTLANSGPVIAAVSSKFGTKVADQVAKALADGTTTIDQVMKKYDITIESHDPTMNVDTSTAQAKINAIMAQMNKNMGDVNSAARLSAQGRIHRKNGGILPGTPSAKDNMLIAAASGEFVVNAAATRKNLPLLNAINSGINVYGAFASGGRVGAALNNAHALKAVWKKALSYYNSIKNNKKVKDSVKDRAQDAADAAKDRYDKAVDIYNELRQRTTDFNTSTRRGDFVSQVTGGLSGAYNAVDQLIDASKSNAFATSSRHNLAKVASSAEKSLKSAYGSLQKINDQLDLATDKVSELQGIKDSVSNALKDTYKLSDSFKEIATTTKQVYKVNAQGVGYFTTSTTTTGGFTTKGAISDIKTQASKLKTLSDLLASLASKGLNGAMLQQIAELGSQDIDQAVSIAKTLNSSALGDIKSLNSAQSDLEKYSDIAGTNVTKGFYKGGIDAAQGFLDGLKDKQSDVEDTILDIAKAMQKSLQAALGIKSPSRVARKIMWSFGDGAVLGLQDRMANVNKAAARLINPNMTPSTPVVSGSVGPAKVFHQEITVHTQEIDPRNTAKELGWQLSNEVG